MGWISSTATRKPFHKPQARPTPAAASERNGQRIALRRQCRGHRARNRHDGADGEIDAARGDDERHAQGQDGHRRAAVQHVDQAAEEAPVLQAQGEEVAEDEPVDEEDEQERRDLRKPLGEACAEGLA